jgi:hypothetical protein
MAQTLQILLVTEEPFNERVPVYKTNLGIDDGLLMIDSHILSRELLFTGIAPVELCEAS